MTLILEPRDEGAAAPDVEQGEGEGQRGPLKVFKLCKFKDRFAKNPDDKKIGYRDICLGLEVGWKMESEAGETLDFVHPRDFSRPGASSLPPSVPSPPPSSLPPFLLSLPPSLIIPPSLHPSIHPPFCLCLLHPCLLSHALSPCHGSLSTRSPHPHLRGSNSAPVHVRHQDQGRAQALRGCAQPALAIA